MNTTVGAGKKLFHIGLRTREEDSLENYIITNEHECISSVRLLIYKVYLLLSYQL